MFRRFERLVETYPDAKPATPPRTFFAFLWQSSAGLRPYILLMTLCTAVIGAFEAMLFAMLGQLVDWLANVEPVPALGHAASELPAVDRGPGRQPAGRRAVRPAQVPGVVRELPDAAALELPPADARPEHELLPGRVRGPRRDQGDADGARRARRLAHRHGHPRVHRHLLRDHARDRRDVRPAHARPVRRLARAVLGEPGLLRAAPGESRRGTGGRALPDDRARDRRIHQRRDGEAVLACEPRSQLRARLDAGIHADGLRAGPPGERVRDHQPRAQHGVDRRHRRRGAVAVGAGRSGCGRRRRRERHGAAPERPRALDHVGSRLAVRTRRHGRGRHAHLVSRAYGGRRAGCKATSRHARRDHLRARHVRLRRQARRRGRPVPAYSAGREDRPGRAFRRRQEHHRQPAAALLRRRAGCDPDRRPGHFARDPGQPARADRDGHPGHLAAAPLGAGQHRLRPARCRRRRHDRGGKARRGARIHRAACPTSRAGAVTTRTSASAA